MKLFLCLTVLCFSSYTFAESDKDAITNCSSTKEYITSFRYLEAQKLFLLKRKDIMEISDNISKGCSGSAKRFIEITDLLVKANVETSDAIKIALKFTTKKNEVVTTFVTIFKETFLKEYLDLDIKSAIEFSSKLSLDIDGDPKKIKNDFQKIVKFCLDQKELDLSGPKCSELALRVAQNGAVYNSEMASIFLDQFYFLTDKDAVDISTYKALQISLNLIDAGPLSSLNFKDAYKFAISKSGLDFGKEAAINYAELMAKRSVLKAGSK